MTQVGRFVVALVALGAGGFALGAYPAHALQVERGTSCADHIYVGYVNHGGTTDIWLCVDAASGCSDRWVQLGDGTGYLDDDWAVYGDNNSSGTGADTIEILHAGASPTGYCAATSGSWAALTNARCDLHYVDVLGDGGADTIWGALGDETYDEGNAGNDVVIHYANAGEGRGGDGQDDVLGGSGTAEDLDGGADGDCLGDLNNFSQFWDCGTGTDSYEDEYPGPSDGTYVCEVDQADGYCY